MALWEGGGYNGGVAEVGTLWPACSSSPLLAFLSAVSGFKIVVSEVELWKYCPPFLLHPFLCFRRSALLFE